MTGEEHRRQRIAELVASAPPLPDSAVALLRELRGSRPAGGDVDA